MEKARSFDKLSGVWKSTAKRNARRLREVCFRLPISSVPSAVLSVFDGMERNMTVSPGDNNRKVKLEAATSGRVLSFF